MLASGLSPAAAAQVAPLFSRHGDDHRHLRAVLSTAFTPKKVEQLRPATRAIAERLTEAIALDGGACELVSAFASPLPPEVFALLFGLPLEDRDRMAGWAAAIALAFGTGIAADDLATIEGAAAEMRDYGRERIAASRAHPGDDLVTRLVEAEVDGRRLSDDDVVAMITGFVFAGAETTRRQLTAGVQPPGRPPRRSGSDSPPSRTSSRSRSTRSSACAGSCPGSPAAPRSRSARTTSRSTTGGRLLLSFTAANQDPERFPDPTAFVVDRADAHAHLTFGWGPHLCVGAGLARLELTEALRALTSALRPADGRVGRAQHRPQPRPTGSRSASPFARPLTSPRAERGSEVLRGQMSVDRPDRRR